MRPIHITRKTARTTFHIDNECGATEATIELTRVGSGETIIYPALEVTESTVIFMWDDALYKARTGRWQGLIRLDGCKPFCVPIHTGCACSMGRTENDYFTTTECKECSK